MSKAVLLCNGRADFPLTVNSQVVMVLTAIGYKQYLTMMVTFFMPMKVTCCNTATDYTQQIDHIVSP